MNTRTKPSCETWRQSPRGADGRKRRNARNVGQAGPTRMLSVSQFGRRLSIRKKLIPCQGPRRTDDRAAWISRRCECVDVAPDRLILGMVTHLRHVLHASAALFLQSKSILLARPGSGGARILNRGLAVEHARSHAGVFLLRDDRWPLAARFLLLCRLSRAARLVLS